MSSGHSSSSAGSPISWRILDRLSLDFPDPGSRRQTYDHFPVEIEIDLVEDASMTPMNLLSDDELERSAVVANCRMNRERDLTGSNGYSKELGFNPLDHLRGRIDPGQVVAWLDLCCGTGKALIQAARISHSKGIEIQIVGVDLVGMFPNYASAHAAWKSKAQASVDQAQTRYFIVHLHRLLDPGKGDR